MHPQGIVPWLLIFVIFYVLMIRPQQRGVKEHQAAIAAIKKGDEVITGGGIRGKVTKVGDDEAEVEIAQGVKVRVIKGTLSQVLTKSPSRNDRTPRCSISRAGRSGRSRSSSLIGILLAIPSMLPADLKAGLSKVASKPHDQPRPRPCRRQSAAARGGCQATPPSSGFRRWKIRSRPSFAAIRASRSATFRPPVAAFPSSSATRRQVDVAVRATSGHHAAGRPDRQARLGRPGRRIRPGSS